MRRSNRALLWVVAAGPVFGFLVGCSADRPDPDELKPTLLTGAEAASAIEIVGVDQADGEPLELQAGGRYRYRVTLRVPHVDEAFFTRTTERRPADPDRAHVRSAPYILDLAFMPAGADAESRAAVDAGGGAKVRFELGDNPKQPALVPGVLKSEGELIAPTVGEWTLRASLAPMEFMGLPAPERLRTEAGTAADPVLELEVRVVELEEPTLAR